jgi:hypothetical protein
MYNLLCWFNLIAHVLKSLSLSSLMYKLICSNKKSAVIFLLYTNDYNNYIYPVNENLISLFIIFSC